MSCPFHNELYAAAAAALVSAGLIARAHRRAKSGSPGAKALKEVRRADYAPPEFTIERVDLVVKLDEPGLSQARGKAVALVESTLALKRASDAPVDLVLNAEELDVLEVSVDGTPVAHEYDASAETLTVRAAALPHRECSLRTRVALVPVENTQLQGLYQSSSIYCTQMEAEGFRRMTPFLDRPDVLSRYTCTVEAPIEGCPVLLSNGNRTSHGVLPGGRHYATFDDPWPKPSYLFAVVAGKLGVLKGSFVTRSGREVELGVYTEPGSVSQCAFALESLKKAMAWDEAEFGRECVRGLHPRPPFDPQRAGPSRGPSRPDASHSSHPLSTPLLPQVRPRHLLHRRGLRFQHGRDGEQVAQRLQLEVRARRPGHRDRRADEEGAGHHRPRVLPQLVRRQPPTRRQTAATPPPHRPRVCDRACDRLSPQDGQPRHVPRLVPADA